MRKTQKRSVEERVTGQDPRTARVGTGDARIKNRKRELTTPWWLEEDDQRLANSVWQACVSLGEAQAKRIQSHLRFWKMFLGQAVQMPMNWLGNQPSSFVGDVLGDPDSKPVYNVLDSMVSTLKSKIAADKTKVSVLTDGGTTAERRKAQLLEQFVLGAMELADVYRFAPEVFVDALIFGTGILHVRTREGQDVEGNKLEAVRVFPGEVLVDEAECIVNGGQPIQFYWGRIVPRERLLALYPEAEDAILDAPRKTDNRLIEPAWDDFVEVREAWHLKSGPNAKDGRHVLVTERGVVFDRPYDRPGLPFAFYRWEKLPVGFYGKGLVQQLEAIQEGIRKTQSIIDYSLEIGGYPTWLVETNAEVNADHLSGGPGMIVRYTGIKPEVYVPNPVPQQQIWYLNELIDRAFNLAGLSQPDANGEVPNQLKSGEAQRVHQAIESLRFKSAIADYQAWHIDVAELLVTEAREIADADPKFSVRVPDDKFLKKIPWKKVDLAQDKYRLKLWPTNILPSTPEGRLETIQELIQAGMIPPEQAIELLDFPDLQAFNSLAKTQSQTIEHCIDKIVDEGVYVAPLPFMNLQLGMRLFQEAYCRGLIEELEPKKLKMLGTWLKQCMDLIRRSQPPPPAAPPPGAPGVPQGAPAHPPTSPLMPYAA